SSAAHRRDVGYGLTRTNRQGAAAGDCEVVDGGASVQFQCSAAQDRDAARRAAAADDFNGAGADRHADRFAARDRLLQAAAANDGASGDSAGVHQLNAADDRRASGLAAVADPFFAAEDMGVDRQAADIRLLAAHLGVTADGAIDVLNAAGHDRRADGHGVG